MKPSRSPAPHSPLRPPLVLHQQGPSVVSQSDFSSYPFSSPQIPFHGHGGQLDLSLSAIPQYDGSFDDDSEPDLGVDFDEVGHPNPSLENRGPSATGDNPEGQLPKKFVNKLFGMVADPEAAAYIQWGPEGRGFIVTNQDEFAKRMLPKHFKHSNFGSFVRQLNMYDFHKTNRAPRSQRTGTTQPEVLVFSHPKFQRDRPDLLRGIKRRAREESTSSLPPFGHNQLLGERRPSSLSPVAGIKPPPGGFRDQESLILHLQRQIEDLNQRLQVMEHKYKELELDRIQPRPQQLFHSSGPVRTGIMAHTLTQPDEPVSLFECHVPESIDTANLQQDDLTNPPTDSQSAVDKFQSTGPPNAFVYPSFSESSSTNPLHNAPLSISTTLGPQALTGGSSSYQPVEYKPNTASPLPSYLLQGISSFNIYDPGAPQVAGHPGRSFPSAVPQTIPTGQHRGARGHPVMTRPAKGRAPAAVPLGGQPPDPTGGLYR